MNLNILKENFSTIKIYIKNKVSKISINLKSKRIIFIKELLASLKNIKL